MSSHPASTPASSTAASTTASPTGRDVVTVAGPDARRYLHSQIAQNVETLEPGTSRWTLVLAPNGRVDVLARVRCLSDNAFELDTEVGFGAVLAERLNRFRIRVQADVSESQRDLADGDLVGWWASAQWYSPEREGADYEAARIAAGWPAMGSEIVPGERIPAEIAVVDVSVNLTKGCYPGQELVERMDSRGSQAPHQLRVLAVDPGAAVGDPIVDPDSGVEVGRLTSVSGGRALGYVRRGSTVGDRPGPANP